MLYPYYTMPCVLGTLTTGKIVYPEEWKRESQHSWERYGTTFWLAHALYEFLLLNSFALTMPVSFRILPAPTDGTTPLCAAALWGNNDMVKLLLDGGANIDAQNRGLCDIQINFVDGNL